MTTLPMTLDDRADLLAVREDLRAWMKLCDEILELVGERLQLAGPLKEEVTEKYRTLKEGLEAAHRSSSTHAGEADLTAAQRRFWSRTVHEAHSHLHAKIGTTDGKRLHSSVWEAHDDMTHAMFQINSALGEKGGE